jgi:hypothetical protein
MAKSKFVVVGADKGGVGKTTVSRILMDYFKGQGMDVRAFDNEDPKGNLRRFHPSRTEIVNMLKSDDQVKVFDKIAQSPVTLLDLRAGMLSKTLAILADVGLLQLVDDGMLDVAVFHVIGNSVASFAEIDETAAVLKGAQHFVVKNHTNEGDFFAGIDSVQKGGLNKATAVIEIPMLDASAAQHIDASNLPFVDFIADAAGQSFTMRGHARTWLAKCFAGVDVARLNR